MQLDIVSDAICPWCYIGKRQLERALPVLVNEGLTFTIRWNPFQLNPEMPKQGVPRPTYRAAKFGSAERAAELDRRVTEAAANVGLEFHLDRIERTPNTLDAHRLIWLAERQGKQNECVERLFQAYFTEGRDIGDPGVLADCADSAGVEDALGFLNSDIARAEILEIDRAVRNAGVNGVPSFFLNGYGLFSGAVPAEQMAEALRRATAILRNREAA
jgi:predicted DsbA family dithiol-disulfide isomerase